jgi:hypothetical protein
MVCVLRLQAAGADAAVAGAHSQRTRHVFIDSLAGIPLSCVSSLRCVGFGCLPVPDLCSHSSSAAPVLPASSLSPECCAACVCARPGAKFAPRRWLFKCPAHLKNLEAVLAGECLLRCRLASSPARPDYPLTLPLRLLSRLGLGPIPAGALSNLIACLSVQCTRMPSLCSRTAGRNRHASGYTLLPLCCLALLSSTGASALRKCTTLMTVVPWFRDCA